MAFSVEVEIDLPDAKELIDAVGIGYGGTIQAFHTNNVLRRMQKYMPKVSGAFIKTTQLHTNLDNGDIVSVGPHAAFLYCGKVMVGDESNSPFARRGETKHVVESWDIDYNQEKNPMAGPYWDKAVAANEGKFIVQELQNYIDKLARANK